MCDGRNDETVMNLKAAQQEWASRKYFVMLHSQQEYQAIRRLFSNNQWSERKAMEFAERLIRAQGFRPTQQTRRNTYEHLWGYLKGVATKQEKEMFFARLAVLSDAADDVLPCLRLLAHKYQVAYLLNSRLQEQD